MKSSNYRLQFYVSLMAFVSFAYAQPAASVKEKNIVHPKGEKPVNIELLRDSSKISDIGELDKRLYYWDEKVVVNAAKRIAEIQGVAAMPRLLAIYDGYNGDFPPSNRETFWADDPGDVLPALQMTINRLSGGVVELPKDVFQDERNRFFQDTKAWWAAIAPKPQPQTKPAIVQPQAPASNPAISDKAPTTSAVPVPSPSRAPVAFTERSVAVWPWLVGAAALVAVVALALKRRA